jgi:cytosine/adenosine deaminase-related metal-dependent hydrolase
MTEEGVIRAGLVLTAPGHAPAFGPAELHHAGGRITALHPVSAEALSPDEARLLLMPALANAHDHGRGLRTLAFGVADAPLENWLPALARQPRIDPYASAALAFARMAGSGVCATNHCHNTQQSDALLAEAEAVSRAARDVGIRVAFAWPFFDRNPFVYGETSALGRWLPEDEVPAVPAFRSLAENMAMLKAAEAFEHPLFELQYGPVGPQWASDETMTAIARASADTGRRVHMHMFETQRQRQWAGAHYPGGLLNFLDSIDLLSPRLTLAHAIWFTAAEWALLAERGVNVSINASSNLRLRSGHAAVAAMRGAGVSLGIGMDGMSLDDDEDMLREMRLCWHLGAAGEQGDDLSPRDMFDMAMVSGRYGITGTDGGGRLVVGAPADIMTVDFADIARDCVHGDIDPAMLVLGRATREHVRDLVVAGRTVIRSGMCTGIDTAALQEELCAAARAAIAPDQPRIERMQLAIGEFYRSGCHVGPDR